MPPPPPTRPRPPASTRLLDTITHTAPPALALGTAVWLAAAAMPQPAHGQVTGLVSVPVVLVTALWALRHDDSCSRCAALREQHAEARPAAGTAALLRLAHSTVFTLYPVLCVAFALALALAWSDVFGHSPLPARLVIVAWMSTAAVAAYAELTHTRLRHRYPGCDTRAPQVEPDAVRTTPRSCT